MLIEQAAYANRWRRVSPAAKASFALAGLVAAFVAATPAQAAGLALVLAVVACSGAGIAPGLYLRVAAPAAGFLALSALTLLISLDIGADGAMAWPHDFEVDLTVRLASARLSVELAVRNTGTTAFAFTTALHSYLAVDAIDALAISGAEGQRYWDAVAGADPEYPVQQGDIVFQGEVDRVYPALPRATLQQSSHWLRVSQPASMEQTVVWNPGAALCATLHDLPADGYHRFVCVEAAQIDTPVRLEPGQGWLGGQTLQVA